MPLIEDGNVRNLVNSRISDSFGLSVDDIADKVKNYGRFSAWLGGDVTKIKRVLNIVKDNGVSPTFFASYEKTEGYNSSWGWLNHTRPQGDYYQDAESVAKWIVSQSNNTTDKPAWIDAGNPKDFVPQSVKNEGNKHFASLPKGTIGRVIIAGTAAATWEVYYPKGLLKEYNGVQDYGKPITSIAKTIKDWGGASSGSIQFIWPLKEPFRITQGFKPGIHFGIDMAGPNPGDNVDIFAIADGTVTRSGVSTSYGEVVYITHNEGEQIWESVYAHMVAGSRTVREGDTVSQGQKLGVTGNTGQSSGVHLHFELHMGRWTQDKRFAVDPEDYLGKEVDGGDDDTKKNYVHLLRRTNMRRMGVRGRA